jgi:hypothetical protein
MAKQKKVLPARKAPARSNGEASLSLRSAESLGRVIGTLQRQLDSAIERFGHSAKKGRQPSRTSDVPMRAPRRSTKQVRLEPAEDAAPGGASKRRTVGTETRAHSEKKTGRPRNGVTRAVAKRVSRPK